jgi:hypothetical protein
MKTTKIKLNLDLEEKYLIYASKKLRGGKSWNQFFEQMLIQLVDQSRDNDDELIASSIDKDVFKGLEKLADDKGMFITDFLKDVYSRVSKEDAKRKKAEKKDSLPVPDLMSEKLNQGISAGDDLNSDLETILSLGDDE